MNAIFELIKGTISIAVFFGVFIFGTLGFIGAYERIDHWLHPPKPRTIEVVQNELSVARGSLEMHLAMAKNEELEARKDAINKSIERKQMMNTAVANGTVKETQEMLRQLDESAQLVASAMAGIKGPGATMVESELKNIARLEAELRAMQTAKPLTK